MSQDTRDSYQERAPLRASCGWFPAELAANEKNHHPDAECSLIIPEPISPRNWALWTKIRILLYNHDGEEHGTLWGGSGDTTTTICRHNPAGPNPVTIDGYNFWSYVEAAIFENMAMTSTGTVIFHCWYSAFFADQETLDTGLLVLCEFENNGSISSSGRICPVFTKDINNFMVGLGKPAHSLIEGDMWISGEEAPP